jgi:hypothetical protein
MDEVIESPRACDAADRAPRGEGQLGESGRKAGEAAGAGKDEEDDEDEEGEIGRRGDGGDCMTLTLLRVTAGSMGKKIRGLATVNDECTFLEDGYQLKVVTSRAANLIGSLGDYVCFFHFFFVIISVDHLSVFPQQSVVSYRE